MLDGEVKGEVKGAVQGAVNGPLAATEGPAARGVAWLPTWPLTRAEFDVASAVLRPGEIIGRCLRGRDELESLWIATPARVLILEWTGRTPSIREASYSLIAGVVVSAGKRGARVRIAAAGGHYELDGADFELARLFAAYVHSNAGMEQQGA